MRYILSSFITFGLWLLLGLLPALAQEQPTEEEANPGPFYHRDEPMKFHLAYWGGNRFTYYWISAQGIITKDTPKAFRDFLHHDRDYLDALREIAYADSFHQEPKDWVRIDLGEINNITAEMESIHIHSCGGDEEAAMELGLIAKAHHLGFIIGQTFRDPDGSSQSFPYNGECVGACILTTMGKSYELDAEHPDVENSALYSFATFQTSLPVIESYARQMSVDIEWLKKLLPQEPDKIVFLTAQDAARLGIDHAVGYDGLTPPSSEIQRCPDIGYFRKR